MLRILNRTPVKLLTDTGLVSAPEPAPYYPKRPPEELPVRSSVLMVRVKGTFRIDSDHPRAEPHGKPHPVLPVDDEAQLDFREDTVFMDDLGRSLEYAGDFVPYKARPEFLVYGKCYQPQGRNAPSCLVSVTVGELRKELLVTGDREWVADGEGGFRATEGIPFAEMPLRWENAYGGLDDPNNPMGKGQELEAPDGKAPPRFRQLPNLEYPDQAITQISDRPQPANFGPLLAHWQPRALSAGTRDQRWATFRAPLPPEDYRPAYFNLAPFDQHFGSELLGTESLTLHNLHPKHPVLESSLPGLRLRLFLAQVGRAKIGWYEVPLRLDTIHLFPDAERLVLLWRQLVAVDSPEEYTHLCLASELADDEPLPATHYRKVFSPELVEDRPGPEPPPLGMDEAALQAKTQATLGEARKILAEANVDPTLQEALRNEQDPMAAFDLLMGWLENLPKPPAS